MYRSTANNQQLLIHFTSYKDIKDLLNIDIQNNEIITQLDAVYAIFSRGNNDDATDEIIVFTQKLIQPKQDNDAIYLRIAKIYERILKNMQFKSAQGLTQHIYKQLAVNFNYGIGKLLIDIYKHLNLQQRVNELPSMESHLKSQIQTVITDKNPQLVVHLVQVFQQLVETYIKISQEFVQLEKMAQNKQVDKQEVLTQSTFQSGNLQVEDLEVPRFEESRSNVTSQQRRRSLYSGFQYRPQYFSDLIKQKQMTGINYRICLDMMKLLAVDQFIDQHIMICEVVYQIYDQRNYFLSTQQQSDFLEKHIKETPQFNAFIKNNIIQKVQRLMSKHNKFQTMRLTKNASKKQLEGVPPTPENATEVPRKKINLDNLITSFRTGFLVSDDNRYVDKKHILFDIKQQSVKSKYFKIHETDPYEHLRAQSMPSNTRNTSQQRKDFQTYINTPNEYSFTQQGKMNAIKKFSYTVFRREINRRPDTIHQVQDFDNVNLLSNSEKGFLTHALEKQKTISLVQADEQNQAEQDEAPQIQDMDQQTLKEFSRNYSKITSSTDTFIDPQVKEMHRCFISDMTRLFKGTETKQGNRLNTRRRSSSVRVNRKMQEPKSVMQYNQNLNKSEQKHLIASIKEMPQPIMDQMEGGLRLALMHNLILLLEDNLAILIPWIHQAIQLRVNVTMEQLNHLVQIRQTLHATASPLFIDMNRIVTHYRNFVKDYGPLVIKEPEPNKVVNS